MLYTSIYAKPRSDALRMPLLLQQLSETPEMLRLSDIGMNCGCDYASIPIYSDPKIHYTRYIHSIGVSAIIWNFTNDIVQAVAGLLHDIATPAFAHTIDFMNGDHLKQEYTENGTKAIIEMSAEIKHLLDRHTIPIDSVCDYHKYPIADNDAPMLSADRLEYTFGTGYALFGLDEQHIEELYADLTVSTNEKGIPELCFQSRVCAKRFVDISLNNSKLFISDEDRFIMQHLADILSMAIETGALDDIGLMSTESAVIDMLKENNKTNPVWREFANISSVSRTQMKIDDRYCVKVIAKQRHIDPLVLIGSEAVRISAVDAGVKNAIECFLNYDQDVWLYAE